MHADISLSAADQARRGWMSVLARMPANELRDLVERAESAARYQIVKPTQAGLCMVRGRMGGKGRRFNLGEMTISRSVIALGDGTTGVSYITGRDGEKAELAAVADALFLSGVLDPEILADVRRRFEARHEARADAVAATRVDFFTMARGTRGENG